MHADCFNADQEFNYTVQEFEHAKVLAAIKNQLSNLETIKPVKTAVQAYATALALAKQYTGRSKQLVIVDPAVMSENEEYIVTDNTMLLPSGDSALLCEAIALSTERIAAIVIKHHRILAYYYKKVRELSSAEGAIMIWDGFTVGLDNDQLVKIPANSQPDLICGNYQAENRSFWLGGRTDLLKLLN